MDVSTLRTSMTAVFLALLIAGCDSRDDRLVRLAVDSSKQQADQNRQMAALQQEVAAGARSLVAADAKSREELIHLQRALETEQSEIGRQRDRLETERREIASQRRTDPIVAAAITNVGLVLACLLPLVLCWYLLRRDPDGDADQAVCELLVEELTSSEPLLLPTSSGLRLGCQPDPPDGLRADSTPN